MADAMHELDLIDIQSGGIKRMFGARRWRSFALLYYDLIVPRGVPIGVSRQILDERYACVSMGWTNFGLGDVMLRDSVQRRRGIRRANHRRPEATGLVEKRSPALTMAAVASCSASRTPTAIEARIPPIGASSGRRRPMKALLSQGLALSLAAFSGGGPRQARADSARGAEAPVGDYRRRMISDVFAVTVDVREAAARRSDEAEA